MKPFTSVKFHVCFALCQLDTLQLYTAEVASWEARFLQYERTKGIKYENTWRDGCGQWLSKLCWGQRLNLSAPSRLEMTARWPWSVACKELLSRPGLWVDGLQTGFQTARLPGVQPLGRHLQVCLLISFWCWAYSANSHTFIDQLDLGRWCCQYKLPSLSPYRLPGSLVKLCRPWILGKPLFNLVASRDRTLGHLFGRWAH